VYIINMSGKDCVKLLKKHGWIVDRIQGSHHIMLKNEMIIPVPVHGSADLAPGTLHSILKKAGLK
jgi:predicted RNA binding protein YcfA (HicA-like mRNA interferase family)